MFTWKSLLSVSFLFFICLHADWTASPTTIDSGNASSQAPLVVDSQGNVTSAWLENNNQGDDPEAAFFSMSLQQWMPFQDIIESGAGMQTPQLIVDPFGTVTLVWLEFLSVNGNNLTLFASRSTKGGTWITPPIQLNSTGFPPTDAKAPVSMVVDGQGNVTIVWLEQNLNTSKYAIGAARFTSDINVSPTLYPFLDGNTPNANQDIFPQVVVDPLGYATAIWQEKVGSTLSVQSSRLDPLGSAWSSPVTLDASTLDAINTTPQIVVDSSGIVTAAWEEAQNIIPPTASVQAARFVPGTGGVGGAWTTYTPTTGLPLAFSSVNGSFPPQIVVDENGSVTIAAVALNLDSSFSVWPSSFAAGATSWTYPTQPLATGLAIFVAPVMVVDSSGTVTVFWYNNNGGAVQAARGFSENWTGAETLNTGVANGAPVAVVDSLGNVTASWKEGTSIQAARFLSTGSTWTDAATLDDDNLDYLIPQKMVVGPSDAVTVVWQEGPVDGPCAIQAARFNPGATSWTPPVTLDNGTQTPNAYPSLMTQQINMVVDAFDNVTVTWLERMLVPNSDPVTIVQSARYSAVPQVSSVSPNHGLTNGGTLVTITGIYFVGVSKVFFGSQSASFTVNSNSQITAVLPPGNVGVVDVTVVTLNGTSPITENDRFTYTLSPPFAPTSPQGQQIKSRFLSQTDIINIIKWEPPATGTVPVQYKIYRNDLNTLIGTVSASGPLRYEDHNRVKNTVYTYFIVSVDVEGQTSAPTSITVIPN